MTHFFKSGGQSIAASVSASVFPMNIQNGFPLGLTGWSPCSPRDSQKSSPAPHFKSINSSAFSFYGPTLISIHDYRKNHSFVKSVMPSNHLFLCRPLLPPSIFPSIRVFSNESVLHIRWAKYWSFSFSISPFNEYSELISFRMDWVGSPCSPRDSQESSPTPQFKSINSLVLSFLYIQLSHPYMTTGKTIALTTRTFVGKVKSLLFNMLSRLVITLLLRVSVF